MVSYLNLGLRAQVFDLVRKTTNQTHEAESRLTFVSPKTMYVSEAGLL
jgi:hypothetical protein